MRKESIRTLFISVVLIAFIIFIGRGEVTELVQKKAAEEALRLEQQREQERIESMLGEDNLVTMENTLLIGDSRTVGLWEYGQTPEADFFCNVGMTLYNIAETRLDVGESKEISLEELFEKKSYDKIYLMIGVNELGYDFDTNVAKYDKLVEYIREKQPKAVIFISANLHVTKAYSDKNAYINNANIDKFNAETKKLANGKDIFYLDVNPLFDDAEGNLDKAKSADDAHVYAKYYIEWIDWLVRESTVAIFGESVS